jgi:hypothetical protein
LKVLFLAIVADNVTGLFMPMRNSDQPLGTAISFLGSAARARGNGATHVLVRSAQANRTTA